MEYIIIFIAGILIGWITKIPWFRKEYAIWQKETALIRSWLKNINEKDNG